MNIEGFLKHLRTRTYADSTVISYRSELLQFERFLIEKRLHINQVKPTHVELYLQWRDPKMLAKPASTRRRLSAVSSFYDFIAVMANGYVHNPVRPLRRPRKQPPRPKPLTSEQEAVLTEGITNTRDAAIFGLLLRSGLRLSELCSLDRNAIRVEQLDARSPGKVIGIGRVIGKGNKEREFLVDIEALRLIHAYLIERSSDADSEPALFLSNRKKRINPRTVQHMFSAWCRKLNLPALHPHQARASYATWLNKRGVPTPEISLLLGHSSLETTALYVKPDLRKTRVEYFAAYEVIAP